MQYIEASVIGIRSAVITLKRRATPLRFVLLPMVHVAEPDFYREVAALAGECALIVAEGVPSRYFPMQALMSSIRRDRLVDQTAVVDYLTETFRYYVGDSRWLTVAHAPD